MLYWIAQFNTFLSQWCKTTVTTGQRKPASMAGIFQVESGAVGKVGKGKIIALFPQQSEVLYLTHIKQGN